MPPKTCHQPLCCTIVEYGSEAWLEQYGAERYDIEVSRLRWHNTHAWWYNGEYDYKELTQKVELNIEFPNGQTVMVAEQGLLGMHRPQLEGFDILQAPAISCSNGSPGSLQVGFPGQDTLGAMDFIVSINSKHGGRADWTQLVNGKATTLVGWMSTHGTFALDQQQYYTGNTEPASVVFPNDPAHSKAFLLDKPGVGLIMPPVIWRYFDYEFRCYVVFIPGVLPNENIPVTLGFTTWSASASAKPLPGGLYELWSENIDLPSIPMTTVEFPQWDSVFNPTQ